MDGARSFRRGVARRIRRIAGWTAMAGLLGVGLVGCSGSGSSPNTGAVKNGGVLRIGMSQTIDNLNPFVGFEQVSYNIWETIYPQLVQYNVQKLTIEPDFATSWDTSTDGTTWTFHTRPNAEWSDGTPLTAGDAAWTLNTIIKFKTGPTANLGGDVAHLRSAEAPDPTTLVLHYVEPVANVLPNLQVVPILPEHVWAPIVGSDGKGLRSYPNLPQDGHPVVSGGPFMLSSYQKNQVALFDQNPHWYGPSPHIDGFGLQFFTDQDALVQAMKSGAIDAIASPSGVPPTAVQTLKAPGIHIYTGPSLLWPDFIINANPGKPQHRELLDPLVREAFESAIDREQIVKTAYLGYAQPGASIIPPSSGAWHDPNVTPLPFDLAKANQLLDQAGFSVGANGIRVADGHPMSYTLVFASDLSGPGDRAFQIIQGDFKKIGVELKQRTLDATAATVAMYGHDYTSYPFDVAMWAWITLIDPDYILAVPTCAQWGVLNDSGYCNKAYDRLYQEQGTATSDAARRQIVYRMQEMIYNSRAYIVIAYVDTIEAWRTAWSGFVESPQGFFNQFSKATLLSVHQVG
jgi:peptide/nickel transport system substrate-binding protein